MKELNVRLRQSIWMRVDKIRHSSFSRDYLPGSCGYSGLSGEFFFGDGDLQEVADRIRKTSPGLAEEYVIEADRICEGRFNLLTYTDLSFRGRAGQVDWHLDPVLGIQAPLAWWYKIRLLDNRLVGDPKLIWELNRHQFLVTLGMAYRFTGEKRYRDEFTSTLISWIRANPPKRGINWASSLELAFRVISWIWCYHIFGDWSSFPPEFRSAFMKLLRLQGQHIANYLSTYSAPNTHLTGEALALFYLGLSLPKLESSEEWVQTGKRILLDHLPIHFLEDGGYVERSLWYHRYAVEIYLNFFLLAKCNRVALPQDVEVKLEKSSEFLMYASRPNKTFPLIGDDDGGRLLPFRHGRGNDLRSLFCALAIVFNRGDFKHIAGQFQEETMLLLGPRCQEAFEGIPPAEPLEFSMGYKKTGYFFMRSDWSETANFAAVDCGPHGWINCGHGHSDLLSLEIVSGKKPLVIDPGTFSYVQKEMRDFFRGPNGHATVKVNGVHPSIPGRPFQWKQIPTHQLIAWFSDGELDYLKGRMKDHTGWTLTREIFFFKPDMFLILDKVDGKGSGKLESRFPLYGRGWHLEGPACVLTESGVHCTISCLDSTALSPDLIESWVSLGYGPQSSSLTLLYKGTVALPFQASYLINLSGEPWEVKRLNRQTYRVTHKGVTKDVCFLDNGNPACAAFAE